LDSLHKVPEKAADYPEFSMFGELPAWGFYVRHAEGVKMKNVKLSYKEFDFRPAIVFDDVKDIELDKINILSGEELPVIFLHNSTKKIFNEINTPVKNDKAIIEKTIPGKN